MLKKVLVVNKQIGSVTQIVGLLSLESDLELLGKLKIFDNTTCDVLVLKIGENVLVFDDVKVNDYEFKTMFHDLSLPICAILTDGTQIGGVAKSENSDIDEKSLLEEFLKNQIQTKTQSVAEEVEDSHESEEETLKEKTDLKEKIENTDNFLEMIKPQLDVLFTQNSHYVELEEKLPGTEWVKVMFDGDGSDHYILGKLFDGDIVTHIAYGIFAENKEQKPPQGLEQYCQFLPLDPENENSQGYYVMYQDALTGDNIIL